MAFGSILLHELGHIAVALLEGNKIHSINILPVGLNAQIEDECSAWKNIFVFLSGPLINMLLYSLGLIINTYYLPESDNMRFFILINIYLAVFNLLPVLPLDGGRILREALALNTGLFFAGRLTEKISFFIAILLIALGFVQLQAGFYNFSLLFIGLYLIVCMKLQKTEAALMNVKQIIYRRSRLLKKGIYQARDLVAMKSMHLNEVIKCMDFDRFHIIHVLDENLKIVGTFTEQEIIDGLLNSETDLTFEEFIKSRK